MLVRDEEANVEESILAALEVCDSAVIVDTGSKDRTKKIVKELGKSVTLHERMWRGFGPNRTELLRLAAGTADYHLMLDADHRLHIDGDQPDFAADSYLLRIRPDGGRLPLLTKDGHPFEYRGVAHSYLASDAPTRTEQTDWISIDGGPGASQKKIEGDRVLLEQAFLENPTDARTVFYLAQTYRDLDMVPQAIKFYRLRADMPGFAEETYWARYQLGCLLSQHVSFAQGATELLRAFNERPTRIESLRALANAANSVADKAPVPEDILFVRTGDYRKDER